MGIALSCEKLNAHRYEFHCLKANPSCVLQGILTSSHVHMLVKETLHFF